MGRLVEYPIRYIRACIYVTDCSDPPIMPAKKVFPHVFIRHQTEVMMHDAVGQVQQGQGQGLGLGQQLQPASELAEAHGLEGQSQPRVVLGKGEWRS